jgi:tellurite methyltransferase
MQRPIIGYMQDEEQHWVALLSCGHRQHVRHNPPLVSRPWVLTPEGREKHLGSMLNCVKCARGEPPDDVQTEQRSPGKPE